MTSENKFEIEVFNTLHYTAMMSMKTKCSQLQEHADAWCFLYKSSKLT